MALALASDPDADAPELHRAAAGRDGWRARRAAMERSGRKHTPFGSKRTNSRLNRIAYDALYRGLRLTGIGQVGTANALAIERREIEITCPQLPAAFDGLRLLHLSDLHVDCIPGLDEAIVEAIAGTAPDLAVLTGDYLWRVGGPFEHVLPALARIAAAARPRHGLLATLGNHDPHGIVEPLERLGWRVLLNETATIERGGGRLHLTGTDDVSYFYTAAAQRALEASPQGCKIALVHSPELSPVAAAAGYALYLCGHTHGGQVCLPNRAPIVTAMTRMPRHRAMGLWRIGAMAGYTSRGAGTSRMPIRFFSRGEVTLITLRRGDPITA